MTEPADPPPGDSTDELPSAFFGALPLILLCGALFCAADIIYFTHPGWGPYFLPIYALLLILGVIAAIGAIVAGFFATETPARAELPEPNAVGGGTAHVDGRPREEFGRPVPDVSLPHAPGSGSGGYATALPPTRAEAEPWNEDLIPPAPPRGPRPVWTTPDDPGDIAHVLEEIADIQRELSTRKPNPVPKPDASARA
jgi:hypothetical protein